MLLAACGGAGEGQPTASGETAASAAAPADSNGIPTQPVDFQFTLPAYSGASAGGVQGMLQKLAPSSGKQTVTGQVLVVEHNGDRKTEKVYDFAVVVDAAAFQITSSLPLDLPAGAYDFYFLMQVNGMQYGGRTANQRLVLEGMRNVVPLVVNPILGKPVKSVTDLKDYAAFPIQYNPADAAAFKDPKLGVTVNGREQIFALNPGVTLTVLNLFLEQGSYTIQVRLYDGALLKQEDTATVSVTPGGSSSDAVLTPVTAQATVNYDPATGVSTVYFSMPQDAAMVGTPSAVASIVGLDNPLVQDALTLTTSGANLINATPLSIAGFQPGDFTWSVAVYDGQGGLSAYCAQTVTLGPPTDGTPVKGTYICDLNLLVGSMQALAAHPVADVQINVGDGAPVAGAVVAVDSTVVGITGSGAAGTTPGGLSVFMPSGSHQISVQSNLCDSTGMRVDRSATSQVTVDVAAQNAVTFSLPPLTSPSVRCSASPQNVTNLAALPGNRTVTLAWTNPGAPFTGATVRRSSTAYPLNQTDGAAVAETDSLTSGVVDAGLENGQTYYYRVFSHDAVPRYSTGAGITVTLKPSPVTNFTAAARDDQSIDLSWTNPADRTFTGVTIRRSAVNFPAKPGEGDAVTDATGGVTAYTDGGLAAATTYYYSAFAHNGTGDYSVIATAGASTAKKPVVVDTTAPGNVTSFAAALSNGSVNLSWVNPGDADLTGVTIRRSTAGNPATAADGDLVADTTGTSLTDKAVVEGKTYYYTAFAHDAAMNYATGASAWVAIPAVVVRPMTVSITASRTSNPARSPEAEVELRASATVVVPEASAIKVKAGNPDFYLLRLQMGDVKCYYLGGKWDAVMRGTKDDDLPRVVKSPTCTGNRKAGDSVFVSDEIQARVITGDPKEPVTTLSATLQVLEWHEARLNYRDHDQDDSGDHDRDGNSDR
jgi:hypothetical protein